MCWVVLLCFCGCPVDNCVKKTNLSLCLCTKLIINYEETIAILHIFNFIKLYSITITHLQRFCSAHFNKGAKGFIDISEGDGGVIKSCLKHLRAFGGVVITPEDSIPDAGNIVEKFHLQLQKLICTRGVRIRHHLLRQLAAPGDRNNAIGLRPSLRNFFPRCAGRQLRSRE